jgi:hypothetical protein
LPLSLADGQAFAADDAVGQADRFLACPVLVHDGGQEAAQVVELQLAALAGDDGHAGVAQQLPVHHHVEDVLARHARLLGDQHGRERAGLGVGQQLLELAALARLRAGLAVVLVPADDAVAAPVGQGLDVLVLPGGAVLLLVGAHADVPDRGLAVVGHASSFLGNAASRSWRLAW